MEESSPVCFFLYEIIFLHLIPKISIFRVLPKGTPSSSEGHYIVLTFVQLLSKLPLSYLHFLFLSIYINNLVYLRQIVYLLMSKWNIPLLNWNKSTCVLFFCLFVYLFLVLLWFLWIGFILLVKVNRHFFVDSTCSQLPWLSWHTVTCLPAVIQSCSIMGPDHQFYFCYFQV